MTTTIDEIFQQVNKCKVEIMMERGSGPTRFNMDKNLTIFK